MPPDLAKYACDECRSRKIRCSRESTGCAQCHIDARTCTYSRSGVIRRRARQSKSKPKARLKAKAEAEAESAASPTAAAAAASSSHHSHNINIAPALASDRNLQPLAPLGGGIRSQLEGDIAAFRDNWREFGDADAVAHDDHTGTGAGAGTAAGEGGEDIVSEPLATLGAEYSSFWLGPDLREIGRELGVAEAGCRFLAFGERDAESFSEICMRIQRKGTPLFTPTPPHILRDVWRRPERVLEKAHLVIAYGILLTDACLPPSTSTSTSHNAIYTANTISKLRWNLRLALNDAKLLLEPSDLNIQALLLLACHVQELSTPSLSWMIVCTACRMLQILESNPRTTNNSISNSSAASSEPPATATKERRHLQFWLLNGLDKTLALMFARSPTLHRSFCARMPAIPLGRMLEYQPHLSSSSLSTEAGEEGGEKAGFRSMFGAHLMRQTHSLSIVLADIWSCLYEDGSRFEVVKAELEQWYSKSESLLQACLLSETPFLPTPAHASMALGIKTLQFHYNYIRVLLMRPRRALRPQCVAAAQEALFLLDDLVSDSNEVYNGVVWMLLYCPFTPFFLLLGEVLSVGGSRAASSLLPDDDNGGGGDAESSPRSLEAMEKLATFLSRMRGRHPRAAKLGVVAETLVGYAKAVVEKKKQHQQHQRQQKKKKQKAVSSTKDQRAPAPANERENSSALPSESDLTPSFSSPPSLPYSLGVSTDEHLSPASALRDPQVVRQDEQQQQPLQDLFNDPSVQALAMDIDFWLPGAQQPQPQSWEDGAASQMPFDGGMEGLFDLKGTVGMDGSVDPYGFFADSTFDWFSWDPHLEGSMGF